jgi:hypothetical protein
VLDVQVLDAVCVQIGCQAIEVVELVPPGLPECVYTPPFSLRE